MKRDIYKKLIDWKNSHRRKPLVLRGARQVGKTHILRRFGQSEYTNCIYINFEEDPDAMDYFEGNLDPKRIISDLSIKLDQEIQPGTTLIILDEIQECPNALNSLKYFCENANEYHVVTAGSLLGVKLAKSKGFPVGKVNFLEMYPLTFLEFLDVMGKEKLRNLIETNPINQAIAKPLHNDLIELLKRYTYVGGMPEAVEEYRQKQDLKYVRDIHHEILNAYALDFAKHAPPSQIMKITSVWDLIPNQLAKENKKFIFSAISKSARAREYEDALQWLADAGLIYKSSNISTPKLPLDGYIDRSAFKLFLLDVGF